MHRGTRRRAWGVSAARVRHVYAHGTGTKDNDRCEAEAITSLLSDNGLARGANGLEHHLLVRTPAQVLTLDEFADSFDCFLFDVGDLAQLAQGIDRNNMLAREYYRTSRRW